MEHVRVIEVKRSVFESNNREADKLRCSLRSRGTCLLNLMSSPGAGKTTLLISLINRLRMQLRIAVLEADIDSDVDARKITEATGVPALQIHTGGMCHLDAEMVSRGLCALDSGLSGETSDASTSAGYDLIILENVGNLVCPAEFDTGASGNMVILSVPEGDDKPLKYPQIFQAADLIVISKTDTLPCFDFDIDKCTQYIKSRNPYAALIPVSAKTGDGMDELAGYIQQQVHNWKEN